MLIFYDCLAITELWFGQLLNIAPAVKALHMLKLIYPAGITLPFPVKLMEYTAEGN